MGTTSARPDPEPFRLIKAAELPLQGAQSPWLIENLVGRESLVVVGAAPKAGKSWLLLEMLVAITSGKDCVGRYSVHSHGPALLFAAEDRHEDLRNRLESICSVRGVALETLPLHILDLGEERLRLDEDQSVSVLERAIAECHPKMVVLDPLVELHADFAG